ncbi:MAG: methionyl-tRNA formyltransferase [Gammaproteobacteria bacterium]
MKLCFLCNHVMALPALEYLVVNKEVVGIGVPNADNQATAHAQALAKHYGIAFQAFSAQQLEQNLPEWLTKIDAELAIVFTFPYRIPASVLEVPHHGFYNVHPGPLPAYRGPNPVFWQIANSETLGGVTVHRMDAGLDTGPVVDYASVPLASNDTYNLAVQKLAKAAQERLAALVGVLPELEGMPQKPTEPVNSSRPQRRTLMVDWKNKSAVQIDALIRACNYDYGGAVTGFRGHMLRLLESRIALEPGDTDNPAGTVLCANSDRGLSIQCGDGSVLFLEIIQTESGCFSGRRFVEIAGIQVGETMSMPYTDAG